MYTMTTNVLATLNQQCKIAYEELHLMSNVYVSKRFLHSFVIIYINLRFMQILQWNVI